ncbi:unnamed protein product, partial [Penicillium egyptiacum]
LGDSGRPWWTLCMEDGSEGAQTHHGGPFEWPPVLRAYLSQFEGEPCT